MQPGNANQFESDRDPREIASSVVRQLLVERIGERSFEHWCRDKIRLIVADETLIVGCANRFLQNWLQKHHRIALTEVSRILCGPSAGIRFEETLQIDSSLSPNSTKDSAHLQTAHGQSALRIPTAAAANSVADGSASEKSRHQIPQKSDSENSAPSSQPAGRRFASLEEFVGGTCNQLALTAARQVCENLGVSSTSLFVYGPVGCGKTHLLEGIYREIRRKRPHLNVVFLTAEQFTNQFTQNFRSHTLPMFRQRFRTVDVLIVDDVDFLDAKRVVQEEFLHTFQQLESHGKQVVVSGERHPRLLEKISDELRTRFMSGMVCRIDAADCETRELIAQVKAPRMQLDLSPETLKFVARKFSGSIREVEGALCCLQVYQRMTGRRIALSAAREVLGDLERDCLRVVRLPDIERAVCDLFGIEADELKSSKRSRSVSEPRMLAMYLARRHTRSAYSEIGAYFGGRNHATAIAADQKIAAQIGANRELKIASRMWRISDVIEALEQQIAAG